MRTVLVLCFVAFVSQQSFAYNLFFEASVETFDWSSVFNRQILTTILLGALSGYTASRIIGGDGFGFFGNIVIGVIGGLIGSWLVGIWKIPMLSGFFGTLISSVGGALILIFFIEIIKYMRQSNEGTNRRAKAKK
jgi:uncharacterized membrane protein YeaQ/YmgE (transglycosylase-associated protein family)